jgi:hypothetical protein
MDRDELLALADRCEAATGPDREIDLLIANAVLPGWEGELTDAEIRFHTKFGGQPAYTASLDQGMTLLPETYHIAKLCEGEDDNPVMHRRQYTGCWHVRLHTTEPGVLHNLQYGAGVTPALALTAACLRAQAASQRRPPMTYDPALVERMVALVRSAADMDQFNCYAVSEVAKAIVAELPEPVDPSGVGLAAANVAKAVFYRNSDQDQRQKLAIALVDFAQQITCQEATR